MKLRSESNKRESVERTDRSTVLIFRSGGWLPPSETFIRNQVDALTTYKARTLGGWLVDSALSRSTDLAVIPGPAPTGRLRVAVNSIRTRLRVSRHVREIRPDLVHAHFAESAAVFGCRMNTPLVVTIHGADVTIAVEHKGKLGRLRQARLVRGLRRADLVIAVSEFIAAKAAELGVDPSNVVVHHIGIPVSHSDSRTHDPEWDVVFVGRLVEKKGVGDLLEAVARLAKPSEVRLAIVGDGPLRDDLEARAKKLGLQATFFGMANPEQVRRLMHSARVFVAPSRTASDGDSEGFGMVFLEAAAAQLPVVSYRHGGVPEAVVDGVTGLLAPEGDVDALSERIQYLLDNPHVSRNLGHAGRKRVELEFDVFQQTAKLEEIYDRVVAEYRMPRAGSSTRRSE